MTGDDCEEVMSALALIAAFTIDPRAMAGDGIGAEILWVIGRLQPCPAGLGLGPRVRLDGCLAFDGGLLQTRGTGLDQRSVRENRWFAAGAGGRLAWVSESGLTLEAGAGLMAPLRRYPFQYESGEGGSVRTVYRMPLFGGSATIGAGFRFP